MQKEIVSTAERQQLLNHLAICIAPSALSSEASSASISCSAAVGVVTVSDTLSEVVALVVDCSELVRSDAVDTTLVDDTTRAALLDADADASASAALAKAVRAGITGRICIYPAETASARSAVLIPTISIATVHALSPATSAVSRVALARSSFTNSICWPMWML